MLDFPILSLLIFLPLIGAGGVALLPTRGARAVERMQITALAVACLTFVVALEVYRSFDLKTPGVQLIQTLPWLEAHNISFCIGVDGASLALILLTTFLMPLTLLSAWQSVRDRVKAWLISFLVLESLLIGTFCARDLVLFYVCFESTLLPMYLIISIWGGENRGYAAYKFFLFTMAGSVLMLVAMMAIYALAQTTDMAALQQYNFDPTTQRWLWWAFFLAFAVKLPMWPLHTWLPDAHVQAPTAGSMMLAGILLKLGGYGFLRFCIPLFPQASTLFAPVVLGLSAIAVVYASFVAYAQRDIKKRIAYSSVAHMGFVTMGLFTLTAQGIQGALFQMISHGLIAAGLFLCVGLLYERGHTREMEQYGGVAQVMPFYAGLVLVLTFAAVGLPGTSGFIGEILVFLSAFSIQAGWALALGAGIVLGAIYMLGLYREVIAGPVQHEHVARFGDLTGREKWCLVPLVVAVLALGIYPQPLLDLTQHPAQEAVMPSVTRVDERAFLSPDVQEA